MIGDALFTNDFLHELQFETPDVEKIKIMVIQAYNKENNANLDTSGSFTPEEELHIRAWLNKVHVDNPKSTLLSHRRVPVLLPLFSTTLSSKVISLSQFNCPICTDDNSLPILNIPIRIAAISKQAASREPGKIGAFEKAIRYRLSNYQDTYPQGTNLCVLVMFILARGNKDKDLDNMSKALLDALKKVLFGDDLDIDHLSLMKTKHSGDENFVQINIRKSSLNLHSDVLIQTFHHDWAGANFLELKDFM